MPNFRTELAPCFESEGNELPVMHSKCISILIFWWQKALHRNQLKANKQIEHRAEKIWTHIHNSILSVTPFSKGVQRQIKRTETKGKIFNINTYELHEQNILSIPENGILNTYSTFTSQKDSHIVVWVCFIWDKHQVKEKGKTTPPPKKQKDVGNVRNWCILKIGPKTAWTSMSKLKKDK